MRKHLLCLCMVFSLCAAFLPVHAFSGAEAWEPLTVAAPPAADTETAELQTSAIAAFYPTSLSVQAGRNGTILCIYQGSMANVASFLLISRNESVATVQALPSTQTPIAAGGFSIQARVTGVSSGTAELLFAVGDANDNVIAYASMYVTVTRPTATLTFSPTSVRVDEGTSADVACVFTGDTTNAASYMYGVMSSNEGVAYPQQKNIVTENGRVTFTTTVAGVSEGSATITVAVLDANYQTVVQNSFPVTVTRPAATLTFSPASVRVDEGTSADVACVFTGDTTNAASYLYGVMSSDESVAVPQQKNIVTENGRVTFTTTVAGVSEGSATITVAVFDANRQMIVQNTFPVTVTRPAEYALSFQTEGGEIVESQFLFDNKTVRNGETYGTLPTATRSGFAFDGWYTAASGGERITPESTVSLSDNQTLYAHWREISSTVGTVSRNGNAIRAEVVRADDNTTVFCVAYNGDGKMIAFRDSGRESPVSFNDSTREQTYNFLFDSGTEQFAYAVVFILDGDCRPLCAPKTA
ncbi:MAG: InlB B-repeat-containing protein [Oscillibacter sp.]|nr:InlB B-repeat-containing protein [Oscillibacter sp.]